MGLLEKLTIGSKFDPKHRHRTTLGLLSNAYDYYRFVSFVDTNDSTGWLTT